MTTEFDGTERLGSDGFVASEFLAMERLMIASALQESHDPYTCEVAGPYSHGSEKYWIECLDIAAASTLTGYSAYMYGSNSPLSVYDPTTTASATVSLSTTSDLSNLTNGTNPFGGYPVCVASYGTSNARVGDGVVNVFDLSVLLWWHFSTPPYDVLRRDPSTLPTTQRRPDTGARCSSFGTNQSRAEWNMAIANDFCYASASSTVQKSYFDSLVARNDVFGQHLALRPRTESYYRMPTAEANAVRVWEWASTSIGSWYKIELDGVYAAMELALDSVFSLGSGPLHNNPAPAALCTLCYPDKPKSLSVRYMRRGKYADPAMGRMCASIVAAATSYDAIVGGVLQLRQQQIGFGCPFDVFVWVPRRLERTVHPFRARSSCLAQKSSFGVGEGSMLMDGQGGVVTRRTVCAAPLMSSVPAPPPVPPLLPAPDSEPSAPVSSPNQSYHVPPSPPAIPVPPSAPGGDGDDITGWVIGLPSGFLVLVFGFLVFCRTNAFLVFCRTNDDDNKKNDDNNNNTPTQAPGKGKLVSSNAANIVADATLIGESSTASRYAGSDARVPLITSSRTQQRGAPSIPRNTAHEQLSFSLKSAFGGAAP